MLLHEIGCFIRTVPCLKNHTPLLYHTIVSGFPNPYIITIIVTILKKITDRNKGNVVELRTQETSHKLVSLFFVIIDNKGIVNDNSDDVSTVCTQENHECCAQNCS